LRSIVLYYSRTGKTAAAAKAIADKTSSKIVEIKDLKSRTGITGWIKSAMDARGMKTTQIDPSTLNTADYDTICIGSPVWGGKPAPAINTVMKTFEVRGKDIILFVTLGGTSPDDTLNLMKKLVEEKGGNVIKTIAIMKSGSKSDADIQNEINEIDIGV
jgi:flavodoxin